MANLKSKSKTFPEMMLENSLSCTRFPNCQECKNPCATEKWVRVEVAQQSKPKEANQE